MKIDSKFLGDYELGLMNMVMDEIHEGICVCDHKGVVRTWNKSCERIYGVSKEEILNKELKLFFPDAVDLEVLDSGIQVRNRHHKLDAGKEIIISASPIYHQGDIIGCVSTDRGYEEMVELSRKLQDAYSRIEYLSSKIKEKEAAKDDFFIGKDPILHEQLNMALRGAETDVPILIFGETGTGKEVFSRFIHKNSGLKGKFVAVNCSAIPDTLFESEFFGYVKGAFTGADQKGRAGYFEQADQGTLFLDEVSELPLTQQTKLLRVIQEKRVRPLGAERDIPVNVRLISACNEDLTELVEKKEFRIDLYYRLKGIEISIPSLRERKEDIPEVAEYFLKRNCQHYYRNIKGFTDEALQILVNYGWYGNMREMENVIRQMVVMSHTDRLDVQDIPKDIRETLSIGETRYDLSLGLRALVDRYEEEIIKKALDRTGGNIAKAAEFLKMPRTTLQSKINQLNIEKEL